MSERGQGQQGQQPQQGGKQGQAGQRKYVVKTDFRDDRGKNWTAGADYEGTEAEIRNMVAQGRIEEKGQGQGQQGQGQQGQGQGQGETR